MTMLRKDVKRSHAVGAGTGDPTEIARFDLLADEWWKPDGSFKLVHEFNRARVGHIGDRLCALFGRDRSVARPLKGLRIIDVGSGAGLVSEPLAALGAEVLGIDAAERNVAVARRHADLTGSKATYRHALPEECAELAGAFDVVMSLEVLEHVADAPAFLAALERLLTPGGVLLVGTINRTWKSFAFAIVGAEYVTRWIPRGTHDWRKFVRPSELAAELGSHGLDVVEATGVTFSPLTFRWAIGADMGVDYLQFHRRSA